MPSLGTMKITEKQLARAIYSTWDIEKALSALAFLLEEADFNAKYHYVDLRRFKCYETTLIVSLARPFEASRNGTTLSLKTLGVQLTSAEKELLDKVMFLRRKIFAHSDEEEMHYRVSTFPVMDGKFNFPHFQFDEALSLEEYELLQIEIMLRRLKNEFANFFFKLAQEQPLLLDEYKAPASKKQT